MSDQQLPTDINEIDWRARTFDDLIEHWDFIEEKRKGYEVALDAITHPESAYCKPTDVTESCRSEWLEELSQDATALIIRSCHYFGLENNEDKHRLLCLHLFEELNKRVKKRPQGGQRSWGDFEKFLLVSDVLNLTNTGLTVNQACKKLIIEKRWTVKSTEDGVQAPHQTLARLYRKFSKEKLPDGVQNY